MSTADHPMVHPKTVAEWRRWLRDNHDKARGVWLVAYKAGTGKARLALRLRTNVRAPTRFGPFCLLRAEGEAVPLAALPVDDPGVARGKGVHNQAVKKEMNKQGFHLDLAKL